MSKHTALIDGNTGAVLGHIPNEAEVTETAPFAVVFVVAIGRGVLVVGAGGLTVGATVTEVLVYTTLWAVV
jgi:hypothetical protein